MRKQQKGFSLIELLIVVAIILIIAAIAIPNLLRAKIAANEASAVGSIRTLNTASVAFSTAYNAYPTGIAQLGPVATGTAPSSSTADLIDQTLALGLKSGYSFSWGAGAAGAGLSYTITAVPQNVGVTGQRYFFSDQSGVIRVNLSSVATAGDLPL
jgi:prepilin-type N-terminal cleavage/methylation domain-containing protein